jgi:hypothetical protein
VRKTLSGTGFPTDGFTTGKDCGASSSKQRSPQGFIRSKSAATGHTAERLGFQNITAVAIAPRLPSSLSPGTVLLEWRDVYGWLRRHRSDSSWAEAAANYLEIAETTLVDTERFVEGTLTTFSGFPFGRDYPFNYLEGKRVLQLALGS